MHNMAMISVLTNLSDSADLYDELGHRCIILQPKMYKKEIICLLQSRLVHLI